MQKKLAIVGFLAILLLATVAVWTPKTKAPAQTYVYPFYVLWDVYCHDPVITITAFGATNYHIEQYNATTQAWEQKYPAIGDKAISAGELQVLTCKNTGVPNEYKFCRVVSDQEVGINIMSLEGSVISAIATTGNYTGTEFIFLGNAKGTFEISLHSSYAFRTAGFALQDGTTVDVYYKVKASPTPPPYDVTSFSVGESWTYHASYSKNAGEPWDTGKVTVAGATGDDIIATKVTSNKPVVVFRLCTDNDEMDQFTSTVGTQFGTKLFFAMRCSFTDLSFNIWNRESSSASATLYRWSASAWVSVSTASVPAKSMAIITTSTASDYWKLESDKEVACTYAAGSLQYGRDQYWSLPSVSTPPAWTTFVDNYVYQAGPEPSYNGPGFQEFVAPATSNLDVDVTHNAAASDISGTFNYKVAGTCSIIDNGVEKSLSISDSWNSMAVTNVTRFKLSAGSVLLWGVDPLLSSEFTLTNKLWTYTGTTNFRFYKGGSYNCEILSINPTIMEAPVEITVYFDIKPGSWPNPINLASRGVLPVAICGTEDFDVTTIDVTTIKLTLEGLDDGVSPIRWSYEDVATPWTGEPGGGHALGGDGYLDLTLKFKTQEVRTTLGLDAFLKQKIPLIITGNLNQAAGGTPITGQDYVWILNLPGDANDDMIVNIIDVSVVSAHWYPGPPIGPLGYDAASDLNGDSNVDILDIALISSQWAQFWQP